MPDLEKYVKLVLEARSDRSKARALAAEAQSQRDLAQDKVKQLELQQVNLQELLATIKVNQPTYNLNVGVYLYIVSTCKFACICFKPLCTIQ